MRKPLAVKLIRARANNLLGKLGFVVPPIPVEEIARKLGAEVRRLPYEGELDGMLLRQPGLVVIGVNDKHHLNRQRFTIAHEIGHLSMHEGRVYVDKSARINKRDASSSAAIDPEEIEANRFAAELLMPSFLVLPMISDLHDIEDEDEISEMAARFGVSRQAMTFRVGNLLHS